MRQPMTQQVETSRVAAYPASPLQFSRRQFLTSALATGALVSQPFAVVQGRQPPAQAVPLPPEIEPLVRVLENTPRERLLEEVGQRVRQGLDYRPLLAALLLAGVRNIQPRPVGFKFHAVMVVYSVHLASQSAPASDRWLPIFWALDYFKRAQAADESQGDWTMGPVDTANIPPARQVRQAFIKSMESWDEAAADTAIAGLARTAKPQESFDLLCRYGARDFRDIGHKAIFVANAWRTLTAIGWAHAEPVLRSLAYALLAHGGNDDAGLRSFQRNQRLAASIRTDWQSGHMQAAAVTDLLQTLRQVSPDDASDAVVEQLNRGVVPQSIWDALFNAAAELMMRQPGIMALHAVTTTNALHMAFRTATDDSTRRLLLLQNAAFIPMFRGRPKTQPATAIDQMEPGELAQTGASAIDEIFADIARHPDRAARKTLAYLQRQQPPQAFMDAARRELVRKGSNAHDYKFTSAVLEDYAHVSPAWRDRYLAASIFNLHGSEHAGNPLVERIRAALKG
ncbi:MAG: hypothetical protein OEU26_07960 [Candidatus Tectomicrobia bacterium]|nr:hypothetical protein [Candidatus Tectomicrobia bacterium]